MGFMDEILSKVKVDGKNPFSRIENEIWSRVPFYIPTGSPVLDWAIRAYQKGKFGGIPHTRLVEIFGPESSGKSSLLDSISSNFQKNFGGMVLLCDSEHAHDTDRMMAQGVNPELICMIENEEKNDGSRDDVTLEQFFEYSMAAVKAIRKEDNQTPILIGQDSLAMINTDKQKEKMEKGEDLTMKDDLDKARVMSQRLGHWVSFMVANNATPIFVNQLRDKPGVTFGDTTYTPGGNALKFLASLRINLGKGTQIKGKEDIFDAHPEDAVGIKVPFDIKKNKMAAPFRKGHFSLMFDERGIWTVKDWLDLYLDRDYDAEPEAKLEKSGSWYSWNGERIGQGYANTLKFFHENEDMLAELIDEITGGVIQEEEEE